MTSVANPFSNGIMPDAWCRPMVDVPSIYADVSDVCLASLEEARRHRKRRSILVHGAAGSGKTHLLARLRAAVADHGGETPPFFCYVRLATSPNMMQRHLRACLVGDLVRKDARGIANLEWVLLEAVAKEMGRAYDRAGTAAHLARLRDTAAAWEEIREPFGELCTRLGIDYALARACRLFLLRQQRPEAVHWLKSGELPDAVREQLGFDGAVAVTEGHDPERTAATVVHQLCRLIVETRPFVICFDQIESLQVASDDRTGFFAFGRLAADLFDEVEATVLITCVQSGLWPQIRQAIAPADYHRLAQHECVLGPLSAEQAAALISARLDASPALVDDPRRGRDPLWPLGEEGMRRFLADRERTPRRLIAMCREAFPHVECGTMDVNAYLTDLFERRRGDALVHIEDSAAAFVHGISLVIAARKRIPVAAPADRPDVDLVLSWSGRQVVISMCNQEGNVFTAKLKRLSQQPLGSHEERILVRDTLRPIPQTSRRAWEFWNTLASGREKTETGLSRQRTLRPAVEALAALEAVRSVMSDARAGELERHGRSVPPAVVEDWIRGHLCDEPLDRLLLEIEYGPARKAATVPVAAAALRDAVLEELQRRHLMRVEELAAATGVSVDRVRDLATTGELGIGVLGDPPTVVFERFASVASGQAAPAS